MTNKLTKGRFIDRLAALKPVIQGKGQRIAEMANVPYETYLNYSKGLGSDIDEMESILQACEVIREEMAGIIEDTELN